MPLVVPAHFKQWLKSAPNMKLSSDAAVTRITHEGITSYDSLIDFDKKSIEGLPAICKESIPAIAEDAVNGIAAEVAVNGANISSISVRRLIVAADAARYYKSIGRSLDAARLHYINVLADFVVDYQAYKDLRDQDEPEIPTISDKDNDRKIIKWAPIFMDCMSRTFGPRGPLSYVLRDEVTVPTEIDDPLMPNKWYGASGSLLDELVRRLPHNGAIYKNDNASVYMKVEAAVRGTSVESTVKAFSRRKDGRGAYFALIANHAGDTKYRAILKKRMNLLQNNKWNGRSYPLETHVSNHRQAIDDIRECSTHITVSIPDPAQRVEYLIDSITATDSSLQAAIGLVRANTNNMRNDFEAAASALIEVDPYRRSQRTPTNTGRTATISAIDFSAGRGNSGVDLRWHPKKEFKTLSDDQKEELLTWMKSNEGKKVMKDSRKAFSKKRKAEQGGDKQNNSPSNGTNWKKKMKKALKSSNGIATVMAVLAEEERKNTALQSALRAATPTSTTPAQANVSTLQVQMPPVSSQPAATPIPAPAPPANPSVSALEAAYPATSLTLKSILRNGRKE